MITWVRVSRGFRASAGHAGMAAASCAAMIPRTFALLAVGMGVLCRVGAGAEPEAPMEVRVVVVTMFESGADTGDRPGEHQYWVEREGLDEVWPAPGQYHAIRGNRATGVISVVTGVGNTRAAASVTALGWDPRFDLSRAYWLVAGIAGIDPADASVGSAAWAEWVVDGDLAHEIDPREMPGGWTTGYVPLRRKRPYEAPAEDAGGQVFRLDGALVDWAYRLTRDTPLEDTEPMRRLRALYTGFPNAQRPPFVLKGDTLAGSTYWHGALLNRWANDWVTYYTGGAGNYVTTAMEDTGTLQALTWLAAAGRVDVRRTLVLRTASNFDRQWPGGGAAESLSGEKLGPGYTAYLPSLEAAHRVGSRVVHAIVDGWGTYRDVLPGERAKAGE